MAGQVGTDPDQCPRNSDLGGMAYQTPEAVAFTGPCRPASCTLAELSKWPAADWALCIITVTNATGGIAVCVSDGTAWISQRTGAAVA